MDTPLPALEPRLQQRYVKPVQAHQHVVTRVAAGPSHLPSEASPAPERQAAWRSFVNERVTLSSLAEPLRQVARPALADRPAPCALAIRDWPTLGYGDHESETDRAQLTHQHDVGYDLATVSPVEAAEGNTLAPLDLQPRTADAVHSTRTETPPPVPDHLAQVLPAVEMSGTWDLPRPLAHVIGREADSVGHYREWDEAGHHFPVRASGRKVLWRERECLLSEVVATLEEESASRRSRDVPYQGEPAWQEVAEVGVVLHRPAKRRRDGERREIPGPALPLRLVVARVRDEEGTLPARRMPSSNAPAIWADAALLALWYSWGWRIETCRKLLKSLGLDRDHWQQESGAAIAKRLLVAAMARAMAWLLARTKTPGAGEFEEASIDPSGRQMKTGCLFTVPALLAGLHVFLAFFALLEQQTVERLRYLGNLLLPFFCSG